MNLEQIKSDFKVVTEMKVRYADLDTLRHLNNASYLSYLEEARIDYFEQVLNFDKASLQFDVVVAHIDIDYLFPIVITDEVKIHTKCGRIGTKSMDIDCFIISNDKNICSRAKAILVSVDQNGNSVEWNDKWRDCITDFEKS